MEAYRDQGFCEGIVFVARYRVPGLGDAAAFMIQSDLRVDEFFLLAVGAGEPHVGLSAFEAVGACYRRAHQRGFTRGIGNAWFGNDVVLPNGNVSFVDVENAFIPGDLNGGILNAVQDYDVTQYRSAIVVAFAPEVTLRAWVPQVAAAFERGYKEPGVVGGGASRAELLGRTHLWHLLDTASAEPV